MGDEVQTMARVGKEKPSDRLLFLVRERCKASSDSELVEATEALCEAYEKTVELCDSMLDAVEGQEATI
jgi:hypothetical protein